MQKKADNQKYAEDKPKDCPYGRYSPCIGYCLQKILLEIKQKKAVREKEGDCLAG